MTRSVSHLERQSLRVRMPSLFTEWLRPTRLCHRAAGNQAARSDFPAADLQALAGIPRSADSALTNGVAILSREAACQKTVTESLLFGIPGFRSTEQSGAMLRQP